VVRGVQKSLYSNQTVVENNFTHYGELDSFDSDGFTVSPGSTGDILVNESGETYVGWNWKADGSGVSNTDGSLTSTVSANTTAGFSIVSYTGNGSTSPYPTVGHGLDQAPEIYVVKDRSATGQWVFWHSLVDGSLDYMYLQSTAANSNSIFTVPTATTVNVGGPDANDNGNDYIAYCFHSVEGFSKFGSYTGNGSTDGPFVYTGFKPAFILWKRSSSTSNWIIWDDERSAYNQANTVLFPDTSDGESTNTAYGIDMLSNGFKMRTSNSTLNGSGSTYIYMAFAENPFKYSNAR